ncbi:MAG: hypothetical protein ACO1Q7_09565 [Gemmatimonas sp.]
MRNPSLFERIGEKVLLLLVGPLDRIPQLYARGRLRFVLSRAGAYATVMTLGLMVLSALSGGPMFRAPLDLRLLALRLLGYWGVQLVVGVVLSLLIWGMVGRLARGRGLSGP